MKFLENFKSLKEIGHNYQPPSKASHFAPNTQLFYWPLDIPYSYPLHLQERRSRNGTHSEMLNKFATYMQPEDPDSEQDTFSK